MIKTCLGCGREYETHVKRQKYCSQKCYRKYGNPRPPPLWVPIRDEEAICEWCEEPFLRDSRHVPRARFCGIKCQKEGGRPHLKKFKNKQEYDQAREKTCLNCGKEFTARMLTQKYCSVGCGAEYREQFRISRKEIYKIRDELGACEVCGFSEVVVAHHIRPLPMVERKEEAETWNNAENIVILCPNHHLMVHRGLMEVERGEDGELRTLYIGAHPDRS